MKTKTRKILALIILAIMVLTMIPITNVFAESNDKPPRFEIDHNVIMNRGEESTLNVTVSQKLKFNYFRAQLGYDENAIEITEISRGEMWPDNAVLETTKDTNNKITGLVIKSSNNEPIEINFAHPFRINAKTKDDAELGKYEIAWDYTELLSDDNKNVDIISIPGSLIIKEEETDIEKAEFAMKCNHTMYPGEEQTISVRSEDKMEITYIEAFFLHDEGIEILDIENGADLPEGIEINVIYNTNNVSIVGFSIQSDNTIQIDPNYELARITIKTYEDDTPEKAEFAIYWHHIISKDRKELIADDTIADIEIMPHVTTPTIEKAYIRIDRNELLVGDKEQVQVVVEPEDAANQVEKIEYSTSDPKIATISEKGIIEAITPGKVKITAVINDQFTSEVEVTVTASDVPETGDIQIGMFASMMIVSAIGATYIAIAKKK